MDQKEKIQNDKRKILSIIAVDQFASLFNNLIFFKRTVSSIIVCDSKVSVAYFGNYLIICIFYIKQQ